LLASATVLAVPRPTAHIPPDNQRQYAWSHFHLLLLARGSRLTPLVALADEFCASTFLKFRSCELLAAAKEYARDENFDAVEVMLARHLELLVPHLLEILSQCPETTPPSSYERLLPPFLSLPGPFSAL
jgi:hypothetical protein